MIKAMGFYPMLYEFLFLVCGYWGKEIKGIVLLEELGESNQSVDFAVSSRWP